MSKKIIGITLASAIGLSGSFAGGMVLSNHLKDKDYDLVIAEKQEDLNSIADSLDDLNSQLEEKDDLIFKLREQNNSLNNIKIGLEETLNSKVSEITNLNNQITELQSEKTELQIAHSEMIDLYNNLINENNRNENEIEGLNQHILTLKDTIDSVNNSIASLEEEKIQLQSEKDSLEATIIQKDNEIINLSQTIESLQSDKSMLQEMYDTLKEKYMVLESNYVQLISTNNINEQQIIELNSQILTLNSQISEFQAQIEQLKAQIDIDPEKDYFQEFASVGKFLRGIRVSDRYYVIECGDKNLYRMDIFDNSIVQAEKEEGVKITNFELGYHHYVQGNGNLLIGDRTTSGTGIYLYNPETNVFSKINSTIYSISDYIELSDGNIIVTSNASGAKTSCVLNADYTFTDYNYTLMSYICEVEGGVLLKGTDSIENTKVFIFYDYETKTLETISSELAPTTSFKRVINLSDGNVLMSTYGSGGTFYYESESKQITLLANRVSNINNYHECANGIVLMDSTSNTSSNEGGIYSFNIETKEFTRLTTYSYDFDSFEEDENGVVMFKSASPSNKYFYSFETGEVSKL